jgi:carboxyl-terminal processing protease
MSNALIKILSLSAALLFAVVAATSASGRDTDLSGRPWPQAFDAMHNEFSRDYPYTEWKKIDWNALYKKYRPQIAKAFAAKDELAYYIALRQYVYSITDGHVRIRADEPRRLLKSYVGGGFGFSVAELADGRVVANIISPDGPGAAAGIEFGAEIIEWDRMPPHTAMAKVALWYDDKPPSTTGARILTRCRYLVRARIGKTIKVRFRNPGEKRARAATLTAIDDDLDLLDRTNFYASAEERKTPVQYSLMRNGIGYLKIVTFPTLQFGDVFQQAKDALSFFAERNVTSLVIDLRRNGGGDDEVTAKVAGLFMNERQFYRSVARYDPKTNAFGEPEEELWVEPEIPRFSGPIAVLISPGTVSNGEGIALALKQRPQTRLIGEFGTNGAYGSTGGSIKMPLGYLILYPIWRALDQNQKIIIESDALGRGGVMPDVYVPRTSATLRARTLEGRDVELEFAENILLSRKVPK